MNEQLVITVFGPTGSGKTDVAVRVARHLGAVVVNADPAQCYDGLPVLTNQPDAHHDAIAPHRLVGMWPLTTAATVAEFARQAHDEIDRQLDAVGRVVVCGGSGLYLRAALSPLALGGDGAATPSHGHVREELERELAEHGSAAMHLRLEQLDPAAAERIHVNDHRRIVRALEAARAGGSTAPAGDSIWNAPYRRPTAVIGLGVSRDLIRARIMARATDMFRRGALEEVAGVVGADASRVDQLSLTARRIHGLDECIGVLRGDHDRAHAIAQMATRSQQYAKRQDTWARRWAELQRIDADDVATRADEVARLVVERAQHSDVHEGVKPE